MLRDLERFRDSMSGLSRTRQASHSLGWFIEQRPCPRRQRHSGHPSEVVETSLRQSLLFDGGVPEDQVDRLFAAMFPPRK
ncbi:hypothetical protein OG439_20200 [Amycolatopsis sp. NBC_01307]|uniref:hypothetical protein n=1 Tax=Amycolatopsis sp. NBC_01307 TaxID=2903561 RepID=UPI002E1121AE|nr:hypothetical protein OG439_20200 [Amycolatopsis sp. NBC_01307]